MANTSITYAADILSSEYGIEASLTPLDSEWGGTFRVDTSDQRTLLLKIAPPEVSASRTDLEIKAIEHISFAAPDIHFTQIVKTLDGSLSVVIDDRTARLYTWIEGRPLANVNPHSSSLLRQTGKALAKLKEALNGFDHKEAHLPFDWSPHEAHWIANESTPPGIDELITPALNTLERHRSGLDAIPHGVNFNDANDHNIIISEDAFEPSVKGFIDFGDLHYGPLINDLAICLAYVMMGKPDPITAACHVISGYVQHMQISEQELNVLLPLTKCRLAITLVKAHQRQQADPENQYWQISTRPALDLLQQLTELSDHLALCKFRHAAGFEPDPGSGYLRRWLAENFDNVFPITGRHLQSERVHVFDWSVGSLSMGSFADIADISESTRRCFAEMEQAGVEVGIGRYDEPRAVYTSDAFGTEGNCGPEMRSLHIGLDLFLEAGTPLYAPLDATVYALCDNEQEKGYGPLLILEHVVDPELKFYTLYGHMSPETLYHLHQGDHIEKGTLIGWVGNYPENGDWVPHVHFQVMTHMLGNTIDFPGVALYHERPIWLSICPDPNLLLKIENKFLQYDHGDAEDLSTSRRELLPANMSISHRRPLHIVRGWKTHLYDAHGVGYLDTRNNIAHVGHEAPNVTSAISAQAAVLNTNTRYLHSERLRLAQRILSSLPSKLKKVFFVNSGSEANDLALRIARAYTETRETIVLDQAYHGHTVATLEVSPYKFEGKGGFQPPSSTHVLPPIKGVHRSQTDAALQALPAQKCTFIHESIPSCAGQVMPPDNYFGAIYSVVKSHGGVCIADEVQSGMGRVGRSFWAFQLFGIEPDIVTIGKPLGNGHPVAAVAVTQELADAFDNGMEYFNSFGGNPVSCAAAHAVLDAIEEDKLMEHSANIGQYWMDQIRSIESPSISDVRGSGLFFGIELGGSDAGRKAKYLQQRMLDHRILTSLDGPMENIVKIKPPLSVSRAEVDYFVKVFGKVLGEDAFAS